MRLQGLATLVLSMALLIGAGLAVRTIFGNSYEASIPALRWLAPLPFLIGLSNVFGIQTMLPLGLKSAFSRILLATGVINLLMIIPLAMRFGATGASASVCITELLVTIAMGFYLIKREIPIFGRANATTLE